MAKLTTTDLANLQSESSAVQIINENFAAVETALENTLSRDGSTPNTMSDDLDLNSNRIINLAAPESGTDAARLIDLTEMALPDIAIPSLTGNVGKYLTIAAGPTLAWADVAQASSLLVANNLSDLASPLTARTNLGLGTAALATIGISGDAVGKLNANVTHSGSWTLTGTGTSSGGFTFSGTGEVRMSATPTTLSTDSVGYRGIPITVTDTDYTFVLADSGTMRRHTSGTGHAYTIPPESSVAYPIGTVLIVRNIGAGVVTLTRGSGVVLRIVGSATDGNKSLAQWGYAAITKEASNTWVAQGTGLS